jgi:hypothetical protein
MYKMVVFSIAALASLVSAAIAQTPEPEPAWRKSALALMPAGYAEGDPRPMLQQVTNCS